MSIVRSRAVLPYPLATINRPQNSRKAPLCGSRKKLACIFIVGRSEKLIFKEIQHSDGYEVQNIKGC